MVAVEGHQKSQRWGKRGDKGRNRMGMTPNRRRARAKFWFSTKTSRQAAPFEARGFEVHKCTSVEVSIGYAKGQKDRREES
jgi:hypothetical protein